MNTSHKTFMAAGLFALLLSSTALAQSSGILWKDGNVLTANQMQRLDNAKMNVDSLGKPGFAPKLNAAGQITDPVVGDVSGATATSDGKTVSQIGQMAEGAVQANGMTFDRPIAGDLRGTGSVNFVKPDPTLSGSVTVTNSIQPSVSIRSVLSGYVDKWWQDSGGSYFSTNGNPAPYKMYINGMNLYGNSDSFTFNMYNLSGKNPFSLWVDADGNGYSQAHGGDYTIYAADGHSIVSGNPFKFNSTITAAYLPKANPGSGSSFLCINESGSIYSSTTACGQ